MGKHRLCSVVESLGLSFDLLYLLLYNGVHRCDFLLLIMAVRGLHIMLDSSSHEPGFKAIKVPQEVKVDRSDSPDTIPWV